MMYYLWRIAAVCIVFGSIQWMYTHPDSQMTHTALWIWDWIKMEWAKVDAMIREFLDEGLRVKTRYDK